MTLERFKFSLLGSLMLIILIIGLFFYTPYVVFILYGKVAIQIFGLPAISYMTMVFLYTSISLLISKFNPVELRELNKYYEESKMNVFEHIGNKYFVTSLAYVLALLI